MKVLVFGAGGVGSVVGGLLARMGHEVSLIGRARHLEPIRKEGLRITGIWGDYQIRALDVYTSAAELGPQSFDLILLTVKAYDTAQAVEEITPLIKDDTILLSLQNGLNNLEAILKKIHATQVLMGCVPVGVECSPGAAKVTVQYDSLVIGPVLGGSSAAPRIAAALTLSKIPTKPVDYIVPFLWAKAIYNCALNGICTLLEIPYGKILERDETRRWMEDIVRECYAVASKKGIALEPPMADAFIDLLLKSLIPKTAAHFPSTLQDLKRGKKTEIEFINGAVCRYGQETRVPTPQNRRITDEVLKKYLTSNKK